MQRPLTVAEDVSRLGRLNLIRLRAAAEAAGTTSEQMAIQVP